MPHPATRRVSGNRPIWILSLLLLLPSVVIGDPQDDHWINPDGGAFNDGTNWDLGVPPTQIDRAFFDLDAMYTVTLAQDEATDWLLCLDGSVTLDLSGWTYSVLAASDPGAAAFEVGDSSLTLLSGTLDATSVHTGLALSAAVSAGLSVDNATLHVGDLDIGGEGAGVLTVSNAGWVTCPHADIAAAGGVGTATVSGVGTEWQVGGDLNIAWWGQGGLEVMDGAHVSAAVVDMAHLHAYLPEPACEATIDGVGSRLDVTGLLQVGHDDKAHLNIRDGAVAASQLSILGATNRGVGEVTLGELPGMPSTWTMSAHLILGQNGAGVLNITNGSNVSNTWAHMGESAGSLGSATVTDADSLWACTGELDIGVEGAGTLTVSDGGRVTCPHADIAAANGAGTVTVTGVGAKWQIGGDLNVAWWGQGTLQVLNGGHVSADNFDMAHLHVFLPEPAAEATIDGVGSRLEVTGLLQVGHDDEARLEIRNGAAVTCQYAILGATERGIGHVAIDGVDSTWTISGDLIVGFNGEGKLTVLESGTVSSSFMPIGVDGEVRGDGAIIANVTNSGTVVPGNPAGVLGVTGDFAQTATGELRFELDDLGGSGAGKLVASGDVSLGGDLIIELADGYTPMPGDTIDIISAGTLSGTFDATTFPPSQTWFVQYDYANGVVRVGVVPFGDCDQDGDVDLADFGGMPSCMLGPDQTPPGGCECLDGDADSDVDLADFAEFQRAFTGTAP